MPRHLPGTKYFKLNTTQLHESFVKFQNVVKEDVSTKVVHESQKDHSKGFGGKFGVQKDRRDSCAEGTDNY